MSSSSSADVLDAAFQLKYVSFVIDLLRITNFSIWASLSFDLGLLFHHFAVCPHISFLFPCCVLSPPSFHRLDNAIKKSKSDATLDEATNILSQLLQDS